MNSSNHFFPEAWVASFRKRISEVGGLILISISVYVLISLLSYSTNDPSLNSVGHTDQYDNFFGKSGAYLADILLQFFGLSSYLISITMFIWSFHFFASENHALSVRQLIHLVITVTCGSIILFSLSHAFQLDINHPGIIAKILCKLINDLLKHFINQKVIWLSIAVVTLIFFINALLRSLNFSWTSCVDFIQYCLTRITQGSPMFKGAEYTIDELRELPQSQSATPRYEAFINGAPSDNYTVPVTHETMIEEVDKKIDIKKLSPEVKLRDIKSQTNYTLPSLDLLEKPSRPDTSYAITQKDMDENAGRLIQVLLDFGVKGKIMRARSGPVVTIYEFEPAPGIKSSRIIGLSDDIARSMSALSARIALIPGKTEIGIELPNPKRVTVNLYSLLKHQDFNTIPAALCLCLGQNITGEPVYVDLARMPHMIVAGTTGSGKSVGINTMILSLLYRHTPATCRFIMIDPKMLELSIYNDIPHLLTPVVTDPKKAVTALKWAVKEMENRYRAMSYLNVRNIEGYNQTIYAANKRGEVIKRQVQTGFDPENGQPVFEEHSIDMVPLPYIVVIVDEMADLMMVAGKEIEIAVQRLAQMARAAGIHVIMATQRPSVDVITGTIKANFPTRMSFQVTSKFDSKTILGEQGAEQLLGRGDGLLMEAGGKIQRFHGPFVSDQEVSLIASACKQQGRPKYIDSITQDSDDFGIAGFGGMDAPQDDLYQRAIDIVRSDKKASTSYIQRRLEIGYNKAATIIERMEADGIVSSANHVGKRQVLI